jgi:hypothetical protein
MEEHDYQERVSNYQLGELLLVVKRIDQTAHPGRYQMALEEIDKRKHGIGPPESSPECSRWLSSSKRRPGLFLYTAGECKLVTGTPGRSALLLTLAVIELLICYGLYRTNGWRRVAASWFPCPKRDVMCLVGCIPLLLRSGEFECGIMMIIHH